MKKFSIAILATLLAGLISAPCVAATLSEMRALNASQKPGTMVVCNELTEIHVKGQAEPVRVESQLTGLVVVNEVDRMVFDVTYTQKNAGMQAPFRTEKYRLTTTLEKTRQKLAVDPQTIELSLPYARAREAAFLAILKETAISWQDYSFIQIQALPDYLVLPGPDEPDGDVMSCTNRAAL